MGCRGAGGLWKGLLAVSTDKLCTVSKIENHPLDLPNDTFVAEMFEGLELPELDALVPGPKIGLDLLHRHMRLRFLIDCLHNSAKGTLAQHPHHIVFAFHVDNRVDHPESKDDLPPPHASFRTVCLVAVGSVRREV